MISWFGYNINVFLLFLMYVGCLYLVYFFKEEIKIEFFFYMWKVEGLYNIFLKMNKGCYEVIINRIII